MSTILGDLPGPRGRRRALVASLVATGLIALAVVGSLRRLSVQGQLDPGKWSLLARPEVLKFLLGGLVNTLKAAAPALVLAMTIGTLLALGRLSGNLLARLLAGAWVQFFRALPLLILVIFMYLGLPKLGVNVSPYWALVIALTIYNGAILGEIFRAGILSLDRGQTEAASAIGLRHWQAMRLVILPQAYRRMIPTIVSQSVTLLKDTSLGFVITYEELLRRGEITGEFGKNPLQALTVTVALFWAVNLALSRVARHLEVRQRIRYRAEAISVAGVEDLVATAVGADARRTPRA